MFETRMASWLDRMRQFVWIPQRVKSGWMPLEGVSWEGEFGDEIRKSFDMPAPFPITFLITAASDTLSMAMTILYGLGKLNDNDDWTRKQRLTVHVRILFSPQMISLAFLNVNRSSVPASEKTAAVVSLKKSCIAPPK
jgi:hypothetical protein